VQEEKSSSNLLTKKTAVKPACVLKSFQTYKPQSWLWLVASVWVMLHMRIKVHSPTVQHRCPGRRSQRNLTESVGTMHTSIC